LKSQPTGAAVVNDNLKFFVNTDNKASFQICLSDVNRPRSKPGKAVVLVRCDRLDTEDNERGLKLAQKIVDNLNTLTQDEIKALVADESIPPLFS
jgi:hypothetical protein